jgi:hypothetical protein
MRRHAAFQPCDKGIDETEQDDYRRQRELAVPDQSQCDRKARRGEGVARLVMGRHGILKRQRGQMHPQLEMNPAQHSLGHHASQPLQQSGQWQEQHQDADRQAASVLPWD